MFWLEPIALFAFARFSDPVSLPAEVEKFYEFSVYEVHTHKVLFIFFTTTKVENDLKRQ